MGYYDPPEYIYPTCPVCGGEAETFYFDFNNNIIGCDCCVLSQDASEYENERAEAAKELAEEMRAERNRDY